MATVRTHIVLPAELAKEIDAIAGPRRRSSFLVETAEKEIKRRKLLAFLERDEPAWREEDHPDIAAMGAAEWVHNLRRERSPRQERLDEFTRESNE
ncbi:MAG: hypothetical protein ABSG96_22715 [Terracidiphilus sp.]|jgi:hypothetical protein